jgi:hypothetical protein
LQKWKPWWRYSIIATRKDAELIAVCGKLLYYGCPVQPPLEAFNNMSQRDMVLKNRLQGQQGKKSHRLLQKKYLAYRRPRSGKASLRKNEGNKAKLKYETIISTRSLIVTAFS